MEHENKIWQDSDDSLMILFIGDIKKFLSQNRLAFSEKHLRLLKVAAS